MDAYDVMREWDRATGTVPRSNEELDAQVPATIESDYEEWKARIAASEVKAIMEGMKAWGMPIAPLDPFDQDRFIETEERTYEPREGGA
jgi:hypothetical protein